MLLVGAPFSRIGQALGKADYASEQARKHRDAHLLPAIERLRSTTTIQLISLPWPATGDRQEKVVFYTTLALGLFHESLRVGDRRTALSALREMARLDLEVSGAARALESTPVAMPDIVKPSPEDAAILERALRRSATRRPWSQEPPPEDTGDHPVLAATRY